MTTRPSSATPGALKGLPTLAVLLVPLVLSLFFLQALRLYFAEIYLVVWAALFAEPIDLSGLLVALLMLLTFLAPLLLPLLRKAANIGMIALACGVGVAVTRPLLSAGLPFEVETLASCFTIGLYALFLPSYFEQHQTADTTSDGKGYLVAGFVLALAYDMAIRALGTTVDLSLRPEWLPIQLLLSAVAIATLFTSRTESTVSPIKKGVNPSARRSGVLILSGLGAILFLEYNLFAHANTIARWVNVNYDALAVLVPAATVIGLLIPRVRGLQSLPAAIAQNVLILVAVASFLWVDGWLSAGLLLLAQVCVMLDLRLLFAFVSSQYSKEGTSTIVGISLVLSLFLAFILLLLYTFSFAYAYTVSVFRGTEPLSFFAAALLLGLTASFAGWKARPTGVTTFDAPWVRESLAALPVVLAAVAFALQPPISPQPQEGRPITVMTYNLHQAFGMDNKLDLEEVLTTIEKADPDIIGFQEADAGRVPSLSVDEVLWLSRRLNMHSAYGPSWGNTYGVAVLSRYPIVGRVRYLLTSEKQQRACLETKIDTGDQVITFFSVHLGLDVAERERQLEELLRYTAGASPPKVLVGDFNATPDSHEIGRVLEQFEHSFALTGTGTGYTSPADTPRKTIDYVFVSPDVHTISAAVMDSLASDHLPVVADIEIHSE